MINRKGILFEYCKAFLMILVVPIISLNLVFNNIYKKILLENSSNRIMQTIGQVSLSIQNDIKRISLAASTISNDDEMMDLVSQWNNTSDSNRKFNLYSQIDSKLNYLFNYTNEVNSIIFFFKGTGSYSFKNYPVVSDSEIRKMQWYKDSVNKTRQVSILGAHTNLTDSAKGKYTFAAVVKPNISQITNDIDLIYFSFNTNIFNNFYNSFFSETIGNMLIVDEDNVIMIAKDDKLVGRSIQDLGISKVGELSKNTSFMDNIKGKKYVVTTQPIKETNWKILNLVEYKTITKDVDRISRYVMGIVLILIMLFLGFSIFFFRDILIPINKLVKKMHKVEKGNFDENIDIKGNYEINVLGETFNKMVFEIKNLMIERDNKERERSKAEIEVLQSQINPHFISNTLNSIRLMAMMANMESISNMTGALIKLLQAAFGKSGKLIKVKEELDNLKDYIYIMKVRYGERFDVVFHINENVGDIYILRLMLQPIIENGILHGVNELEEKGLITIDGFLSDGDLIFEITDNGVGMTEEQIQKVLGEDCRNTKGFTGMGIMNVDRRIKLNYGEKYGISIESILGKFTKVKITLPIINDGGQVNV